MDPLPSSRGYRLCFSFSFFVFRVDIIRISPADIRGLSADFRGLCDYIRKAIVMDWDCVFSCLLNLSGLAIGYPEVLLNLFYFCVWID